MEVHFGDEDIRIGGHKKTFIKLCMPPADVENCSMNVIYSCEACSNRKIENY